MSSSKVFVLDDNDDFRLSIAWMLRGEGHLTVDFDSPKRAINALKLSTSEELKNSCLLLDVRMPEMSGLEFHELLRQENIALPVIYMTGHANIELTVEAMKKGAVTFLEKPLDSSKLESAIQSALVSSAVGRIVDHGLSTDLQRCAEFRQLLVCLTSREKDVLRGIVEGYANKVIARKLNISPRTVEVHRARIMKKLKSKSASELVKLYLTCDTSK